jgi:hypothetical protein
MLVDNGLCCQAGRKRRSVAELTGHYGMIRSSVGGRLLNALCERILSQRSRIDCS